MENASGATKRAATAAVKAATEAENAAFAASEIVTKAKREAEAQALAQAAVVRAAVAKARTEAAQAAVTNLDADLGRIKKLEGLLSICMTCKKIRTKNKTWDRIEKYISDHSDAIFSHGICPECLEKARQE